MEIPPSAADDVTCFTLLEVIEHLDAPWEGALSELLGRCKPHLFIVTTPNVEFNLNYMVNCKTERSTGKPCRKRHKSFESFEAVKRAFDAGEICKGCKVFTTSQAGAAPPIDEYPKRNKDHRFEWTREQFRGWAMGLAVERGYAVRFDGVGGGAWDETRRNISHGPGPSSQMAIFTRRTEEAAAAAVLTQPAERLLEAPEVVWSSAALDTVAAGTAAMLTVAAHADEGEFMAFGENHEYRSEW